MELILASGSPRRRELMELIGLCYSLRPSEADEHIEICPPAELVMRLARRKAASVKKKARGGCVIGADTVVYLDGQIIGKPENDADASRILHLLSGRTHTVYTGVCLLTDEREILFYDTTDVTFACLSDAEIADYIASGEPRDKAGAYGVQGIGAVLVERVEGCYFNVIGLPVPKVYRALSSLGALPGWRRAENAKKEEA